MARGKRSPFLLLGSHLAMFSSFRSQGRLPSLTPIWSFFSRRSMVFLTDVRLEKQSLLAKHLSAKSSQDQKRLAHSLSLSLYLSFFETTWAKEL